MPKGTSEIKHYHQKAEQFFYVLEGVLTIALDSDLYELHSNESLVILPNMGHKVFNHSDQEVKFLVISAPNSHGDRIDLE